MVQFRQEAGVLVKERGWTKAVAPEEIERRRRIVEEIDRLGEQVKPPEPGNSLPDYLRQMKEED